MTGRAQIQQPRPTRTFFWQSSAPRNLVGELDRGRPVLGIGSGRAPLNDLCDTCRG